MKNIFIIILLILCSGCIRNQTIVFGSYNEYKTSLIYENISENGWEIFAPLGDTWHRTHQQKSLLPEYFTQAETRRMAHYIYNYFFAKYNYAKDKYLALWIRPDSLSLRRPVSAAVFSENDVPSPGNLIKELELCKNTNAEFITVSLNPTEIDFNSKSIFLLSGQRKIFPIEVFRFSGYNKIVLDFKTFNLADPDIITLMQPFSVSRKPLSFPTFYFKFSPITCRELDNAVLVIDGFSHQGKPIPPLKVRINYAADYNIPEYVEPPIGSKNSPETPFY